MSPAECKVKGVAGSRFADFLEGVLRQNARSRLLPEAGLLTFLEPLQAEGKVQYILGNPCDDLQMIREC